MPPPPPEVAASPRLRENAGDETLAPPPKGFPPGYAPPKNAAALDRARRASTGKQPAP